jgi:SAM-dependent methyltransferase
MRRLLDTGLRARPGARSLLDVGAASGLLVAEARARGLDAVGVEPSGALRDTARARHGVELLAGVLPHPALDGRRFDLVFLVDVLEHVADPIGLLRECARRLAPAGILVVVTPDAGSVAARLLGRRWWHFRLAHVGYFNRRSLARAVERAGLVTVAVRRAKWYFAVDYLATRLEEYLPLGWLTRLARRSGAGRALFSRTVPLDLRDSFLLLLRGADAGAP